MLRRLLCFFLPLVSVPTAQALQFLYPVGHSESLSAGVGIAHLGSPAGLVYNPASLGGVHNSSLSMSGSTYYILRQEFNSNNGESTSFNSVPNAMVSAWKIGPGALAAGIVTNGSADIEVRQRFTVLKDDPIFGKAGSQYDVATDAKLERILAGLAWGQQLIGSAECDWCGLYGGVSLLGSYQTLNARYTFFSAPDASSGTLGAFNGRMAAVSLVLIGGLTWHVSPGWNLGVSLQAPSLLLSNSYEGTMRLIRSTPNGNGTTTTQVLQDNISGNNQTLDMWQVTLGSEWRVTRKFIMMTDAMLGEKNRPLGSPQSDRAPVTLGVAGRYLLDSSMALIAGTKLTLTEMFVADSSSETQALSVLGSLGLMWRKKDYETAMGVFDYQHISLNIPDSVKNNPNATNNDAMVYIGFMVSGLYRF